MPLVLREFVADDAASLMSWVPTRNVMIEWSGYGFEWPLTTNQILKRVADRGHDTRFCIATTADGASVGYLELGRIDHRHKTATLGRVLVDPSQQSKGVGRQMVRSVLAQAFDELDLHRVELSVYIHNAAAIRCYEAVGFVREGVRRDITWTGAEYWSEYLMSVLRAEWDALSVAR